MNFYNYSKRVLCAVALAFAFLLPAAAQVSDPSWFDGDGWYQVKRYSSIKDLAAIVKNPSDASNWETMFQSAIHPYNLDTNEEMVKTVKDGILGVINVDKVYGTSLTAGETFPLTSIGGALKPSVKAERGDLSTYYYIRKGQDGGFTFQMANGHYLTHDGTVSITPEELYLGSPLDITFDNSLAQAAINALPGILGYTVGTKPTAIDLSSLSGGKLNMSINYSDKWELTEEATTSTDPSTGEEVAGTSAYLGGKSLSAAEVINFLKEVSQVDWSNPDASQVTGIIADILAKLGGDSFKFEKRDLNSVPVHTGSLPFTGIATYKDKVFVPYTVNIEAYGENFEVKKSDKGTGITAITKNATNQNAHIEVISGDVNGNNYPTPYSNTTLLYDGATVFVPSEVALGHNVNEYFELITNGGTDVQDFSTSQIRVCADNDAKVLHVFLSQPTVKTGGFIGIGAKDEAVYVEKALATGIGYATLNSPFALNIPAPQEEKKNMVGGITRHQSELKAYIVGSVDGSKTLELREITTGVIPAHTPVVLYGTYDNKPGGTFQLTVNLDNTDEPVAGNMLAGTCFAYNIPNEVNAYVMKRDNDAAEGVAFQHVGPSPEYNRVLNPFLAYLVYDGGASGASFTISKNSEVTGIENVEQEAGFDAAAPIYDLSGRRVAAPAKGIFIQNGKKVIFK